MQLKRHGFSIIEYVFLIILMLCVVLVFRNYILRGFSGKYKSVGDTYGMGRQYDATKTIACSYDDRLNMWYDDSCFDNERQHCAGGDQECEKNIINGTICRRNFDSCNKN